MLTKVLLTASLLTSTLAKAQAPADSKPNVDAFQRNTTEPTREEPIRIKDSDHEANTTRGSSMGVRKFDNHASVSIIDLSNHSSSMRFSTSPQPRFAIEWHRNRSLLDGDVVSDVWFSNHILGLVEVNSTYPLNTTLEYGRENRTVYLFRTFDWSNLTIVQTNLTTIGPDARVFTFSTTGTSNNVTGRASLTVKISAATTTDDHVDSDNNTVHASGFKYSIDVTGTPSYKMLNSNFALVNMFFSSGDGGRDLGNNTLATSAGRFDWVSNIMIDGVNSSLTRDSSLNETSPYIFGLFGKRRDHDGQIEDFRCSKRLIAFNVPRFSSNFSWDPSNYVDKATAEAIAKAQYSSSKNLAPSAFGWMVMTVVALFML